ncbi:MAG: carboxymuconolactone decarboxylase family protein [Rhodobiaceae bacterium]|nr:carboxymuconolactone decarboxylase family protein [Rhodobiaceae bacterium]
MAVKDEVFDRKVGRVRLRQPEDMTPEELDRYHNTPTGKMNLSRLFAVAETMAPHLTAMNMAMATQITIPPMERELLCLATLHLDGGSYEIAQHVEVAKMMGFPDEKFAAIAAERYRDPVFDERERALLAFARQVVKTVRVDDFVFDAVAEFYDSRQIVEAVFVIANYMMILRISEVAEIEIDSTVGASFWKKDDET